MESDDRVLHFVLIFEEPDSYMGKEMILDMSSCSNILLRRVDVTSADGWKIAEKFSIDTRAVPQVMLSTVSQQPRTIDVKMKTRYFYVYQLEQLAEVGKPKAKLNWQISNNAADASQYPLNGNSNIKDHMSINWERSYLADIESAMNYLFTVEVSANKKLD